MTRLAQVFAVALLAAGCVTTRPRTEVVVEVHADMGVAGDTTHLDIEVAGGPTSGSLDSAMAFSRDGGFPFLITVVPRGDDPTRVWDVIVTARTDAAFVARARVRGRYTAGETVRVELTLEDRCRGVSCASDETCRAGTCTPIAPFDVDAGRLDATRADARESDAESPVDASGDASGALDASWDGGSARMDAGFDATSGALDVGHDAATSPPDAGSDVGEDAGSDAGSDAGQDAGRDAGRDAGVDGGVDAWGCVPSTVCRPESPCRAAAVCASDGTCPLGEPMSGLCDDGCGRCFGGTCSPRCRPDQECRAECPGTCLDIGESCP